MTGPALEPARVADVLRAAPSLRKAVQLLGTSPTRLRDYCRSTQELREAFLAAKSRGLATRKASWGATFKTRIAESA